MRRLLLALAFLACSELTAPDGAVPIYPIPAVYREWWSELESCSGFSGDIDAVRFYSEPYYEGHVGKARWQGSTVILVLAEHAVYLEWYVKHEMMHVLGRIGGHPAQYFNGVCGNLVTG